MKQNDNIVRVELGEITNKCFVIMPFDSLFQTQYEKVIRPAVESLGLKCVRADEVYSRPNIVGDIWRTIREARVVIAELTNRNPNVFYEIGLAHAIGKPIIFLTRNENDVPFDLKALRYRFYDTNDPFWGENLTKAIQSMVQNVLDESNLSSYLEGIYTKVQLPQQPEQVQVETSKPIPAIDISGSWQGLWKRETATIDHTGTIYITQLQEELSATMTVTFEKAGNMTIVQEILVGSIKGLEITLNGVSYTYIKQGVSISYLLDSFNLQLSDDRRKMEGVFQSKRGRGKAEFEKIDK